MSAADGWPYLPQGSHYVLTGNHKIKGESTAVSFTKSGMSVPAPKDLFSVTMQETSYSSYDKYKAGDQDAANEMDAFTIKEVASSWTVAANLINNSNYSKSLTYTVNIDDKSTTTAIDNISDISNKWGDRTGLAVGTYSIYASLTFDGVKVDSEPKNHYITGIPYKQEPPVQGTWKEEVNHAGKIAWNWDGNNVNLRPNPEIIRKGYARVTTNQSFYLPTEVNVNVLHVGKKIGRLGLKYYLRFGTKALIDGKSYDKDKSVNYDASEVYAAGTYKAQVESTYGAANTTSSFNVTKIHVLYGSLP